ncbi:hypothetical protein [Parafrankia sp. EUN1f]|uniref:hypothetical protein n=1 Tax=Parafrankia sp. EUN1f TaxID=102897 RepID=UPI0001C45265|nr:hypothetical protein [Parafrankia sp. EUN1f]EFC79154.1 hypothetical protein FrEUN1fDRAFT_7733 [Parafrankia sp. EUN1f]
MLDVEVPAGVDSASGRVAGSGAATWTERKRPLLVAGSFVVAILLGVVLGLAWASDEAPATVTTVTEQPDDSILSPEVPAVSWAASRVEGRPHKVTLSSAERQSVRLPLQWLAAWKVRQKTPGSTIPTMDDVTIVKDTLFYGAIEGADTAHDQFWAVAQTEIKGVPDTEAPDPHVWKRVGSAPWTLVALGPGACNSIPAELMTVLSPGICAS